MKKMLAVGLCVLLVNVSADAVIVGSGDGNQNTTAPTGDQGWSSMAIYNGASAVYLGDGWFITARHLGSSAGSVNYDSNNYSIDADSWVNITNSTGTAADIRLFQVSSPESISGSGSQVNSTDLSTGISLTMIGYGRDVSSIVTNTYNNQGPQTQVRYYEGTTSQMKWGINEISGSQPGYETLGFGYFSDVLETTFLPEKAQGLDKDSGGGVFVESGTPGEYLLAGIMIGAVRYSDENGIFAVIDTGSPSLNSETYSVDLSVYSDQITEAIPEPSVLVLAIVFPAIALGIRRFFLI